MTKRRSTIPKRSGAGALSVNVEMAAAGYLHGFWREQGMESRRYWQGIAHSHSERILEKLREAAPGTRPGFEYAIGKYPPLPLIGDPPPHDYKCVDDYIEIDGVRFWYCGSLSGTKYLKCQAKHLRDLGELDGAEWASYLAWRRTGYEARYVLDGASHKATGLMHMCY